MKISRNSSSFTAMIVGVFLSWNAQAATISGTIKYDGDVPKFNEIKMDADPVCVTHHTTPVYPQTLVVGEGNTLGNVFVYIKSGLPKKDYPAPAEPVVIDQKGCQYTPHVTGAMVGQTIKFLNPDGTLHNIHAICKINQELNTAMPKFRTEITKVFDKEEFMFPLKCDVHPWMNAWIAIMSHPFFSTTHTDGKFKIENIPAGSYEIEVWHEKLGTQKSYVTFNGNETKEVKFVFTNPQNKEIR